MSNHQTIWNRACEIAHVNMDIRELADAFELTGNTKMAARLTELANESDASVNALYELARDMDPDYDPEKIVVI